MMKMKLTALLLAFTAVLTAGTGCHGTQKELPAFDVPETFDDAKPYEITFWAKNDTNITQVNIYKETIADFEALYPNITVNLRLYTDYGRIYNDVITNIQTGTTPNVCITYPDHIATYLTGTNVVLPLDELMSDEKYGLGGSEVRFDAPTTEEIVPKFLSEGTFAGRTYALPFMRSTEACYVNKDFVEALGYELPDVLTWDFVWEVADAAAATKGEDGTFAINGQKVLLPFIYKSTDNMMISLLRQMGGDYSTADGRILLFNSTTRDILETVAEHTAKGAFSTFKISGYPANFLNAGQCIFAIDSTAGATWMGSDAPLVDIPEENLVEFETVVYPIPQIDPENPVMISQGPSVCIFNKEDEGEVLASWLFMQYLLTNKVQISYAGTEGYLPVTLKAQASEEYRDYLAREGEDDEHYYDVKLKASRLLLENIDNTFVTPVFNGSASLRDAAGQLIESVTKSVRRGQTVDDAYYEELWADTVSLYRLDQVELTAQGKSDLGPLPKTSIALLCAIGMAWVGVGGWFVVEASKKRKK